MAISGAQHTSGLRLTLLAPLTIAAAVSATATTPVKGLAGMNILVAQATFLYGAGGTNATAYIQTSFDVGLSWIDVMSFQFTTAAAVKVNAVNAYLTTGATPWTALTPTDGTLTANTAIQGILGDQIRLKYVTTGTYSGATSLAVYAIAKG